MAVNFTKINRLKNAIEPALTITPTIEHLVIVNPRPTGTPGFPSPTGGGGVEHPLSISAPIDRREKRKKKRSEAREKLFRNYFSQFFAKVKIVAPRVQSFSRLSNIVSEKLHYLGNYYS